MNFTLLSQKGTLSSQGPHNIPGGGKYCTGNFIDDYAVDEIERNDRSFIFVVETDGQVPVRLLLYPTVIEAFQARRAPPRERKAIMTLMQRLSMKLNTATNWNEQKERLEIRMY